MLVAYFQCHFHFSSNSFSLIRSFCMWLNTVICILYFFLLLFLNTVSGKKVYTCVEWVPISSFIQLPICTSIFQCSSMCERVQMAGIHLDAKIDEKLFEHEGQSHYRCNVFVYVLALTDLSLICVFIASHDQKKKNNKREKTNTMTMVANEMTQEITLQLPIASQFSTDENACTHTHTHNRTHLSCNMSLYNECLQYNTEPSCQTVPCRPHFMWWENNK